MLDFSCELPVSVTHKKRVVSGTSFESLIKTAVFEFSDEKMGTLGSRN